MQNFSIHFTHPWLMLLLIPALALTVIPYFLLSKRFRRTRNRIISMILHMVVMLLCISVLSGIGFSYEIVNDTNEILLLVDVSDTQETVAERRDEFVETVLREGRFDGFRVGVVTFGFTQEYAVPLTEEVDTIYDAYLAAPLPDRSGTDIAAALTYARSLFTEGATGKIVLISDGKETDEEARSIIRGVAAQGVSVDTAYLASGFEGDGVQILNVTVPDRHVRVGETCEIGVTVRAAVALEEAEISLFDNGRCNGDNMILKTHLASGVQDLTFNVSFSESGMHELYLRISTAEDSVAENNEYYSYFRLEIYNNVLILEQADESERLVTFFDELDEEYNVEVKDIHASTGLPLTIDELRMYDQVVLNNIANSDLPAGFDGVLYSFVHDYGGGLLTTGGVDASGNAHAYNRTDMLNTLYQEMLPVLSVDYTPPVGVMLIVDTSGSMSEDKIGMAQQGAISCLDALTARDYVGVMTADTTFEPVIGLTSASQHDIFVNAVLSRLKGGGSTVFSQAIHRAATALVDLKQVARRHIILITDGEPTEPAERYLGETSAAYRSGVTLSVVGIESDEDSKKMQDLVAQGHGRYHTVSTRASMVRKMREDLSVPEIKAMPDPPEDFQPHALDATSPLFDGVDLSRVGNTENTMPVVLGGFFGTQAKDPQNVLLGGDFDVPIYAQWDLGAGKVGSFMCDLTGRWSLNFLTEASGKRFLSNIFSALMPTENLRPSDIRVDLKEDNFTNSMSVVTDLSQGERVEGKISYTEESGRVVEVSLNDLSEDRTGDVYVTLALSETNNYTRCNFVAKRGGVYRIALTRLDAEGNVLSSFEAYKSFAYSEEYLPWETVEEQIGPEALMAALAEDGKGTAIAEDDPSAILDNFELTVEREYDPRLVFMIVAMILFLLDIAIRKFKFKWPHEIYRDYKKRKEEGSES